MVVHKYFYRTNLKAEFVTGKLVKPDQSSATYTSFIGCSDRRIELDEKINVDSIEYKSMLSIMASKISYESKAYITSVVKDTWKVNFISSSSFLLTRHFFLFLMFVLLLTLSIWTW